MPVSPFLLASLVTVLLSPSSVDGPGLQSANADHFQGPTATGICAGDRAPVSFALPDTDGRIVSNTSFIGKVVVLSFFDSAESAQYRLQARWLVELQETYARDVVVLGVDARDTADDARVFAKQQRLNYPLLLAGGDGDALKLGSSMHLSMNSWPTAFIGRDGRLCRELAGIISKSQVEGLIKALM